MTVQCPEMLPDEHEIRAGYDRMWEQGYADLLRGDVDVDPVPDDTASAGV
jgi:hypothetical protein